LLEAPIDWYGPAAMVRKADVEAFPQSLGRLPLLLPTPHSSLRPRLDRWFETQGFAPRIVGEFEDSALLSLFAARGMGVFPVSQRGATEVSTTRGLRLLGTTADVTEEIHAIHARRGAHHALVQQVLAAAKRHS
jgi:LysR family transcriptional activator of nhaA